MNRQFLKDAVGWGFVLWLIGSALGIVLFALVRARTHLINGAGIRPAMHPGWRRCSSLKYSRCWVST
jgi:hypothetical protein